MSSSAPEKPTFVAQLMRACGIANASEEALSPRLEERMIRMEKERHRRLPGRGFVKS